MIHPEIQEKKIYLYMLVNDHLPCTLRIVLILITIFHFSINPASAQTWSLEQCIDTAMVHNRNLSMANDDLRIAQEKNKEAKANLIPKVNINGDYRYYIDLPYQLMPEAAFGGPEGSFKAIQFGVPHNISANAQLSMPIYNPQLNGGIKNSQIAMEISQLQFQKTKEQVIWDISNLYYNAQILINLISLLENNAENLQTLHTNTMLLHEQKLALGTDVKRVQLQLEQINIQIENTNSQYSRILNALKVSIGVPLDETLQVKPDVQFGSNFEYDVQSTIDIKLANTQNLLINSELTTLKQSRLPYLSLFGMYGTSGFGYTGTPNEFLDFYAVGTAGLQLSYPIFSGTITKKRITQKRIELQKNESRLSLVTSQNEMEIENAGNRLLTAQNEVNMRKSQTELAKTIYQDMALQHREGLVKLTDVLLADNDLQEAQHWPTRGLCRIPR